MPQVSEGRPEKLRWRTCPRADGTRRATAQTVAVKMPLACHTLAGEVLHCGAEASGIILEVPERQVAPMAEQTADCRGRVVVVNMPASLAARGIGSTNRAATALGFEEGGVFLWGEAIEVVALAHNGERHAILKRSL